MKDKLKGFFGGEETQEVSGDEGYYSVSREEFHEQNGMAASKMMLLEPRAYSESQQIADYLKNRSAVVVNLKRVTPDQAKRIVDFLYGTIYAIGGDIQKLGGGIFLCTPNNVNVEGKISDDQAPAKQSRGKKDSKEDEEEDFF
ncbi:MAG: cell division protein SepF [Bacilli bacterium]|nr:cell division protein SepF [Bacilli bacterium]